MLIHNDTDPWDERRAIDDRIAKAEKQRWERSQERTSRFDAGAYTVPGVQFISTTVTSPMYDLTRLVEHVGIPLRLASVDLFQTQFSRALRASKHDQSASISAMARATITKGVESINDHLDRVVIATLPFEDVTNMIDSICGAVEFGKFRLINLQSDGSRLGDWLWMDRLGDWIELLSRLSIRCSGDAALKLFYFGASLANDTEVNQWIHRSSLKNLISRSLEGLEPNKHSLVALEVLRLQLSSRLGRRSLMPETIPLQVFSSLNQDAWRVRKKVKDGITKQEWSSHVAALIDAVGCDANKELRRDAADRLSNLLKADALKKREIRNFQSTILQHAKNGDILSELGLFPDLILKFPNIDFDKARITFDANVVNKLAEGLLDGNFFRALFGASYSLQGRLSTYKLPSKDALSILDHALNWQRRENISRLNLPNISREDDYLAHWIGRALAATVLPSLSRSVMGDDRIRRLFDRASDGSFPTLMESLPVLVKFNGELINTATEVIQKGLISQDEDEVTAALTAVLKFAEFAVGSDVEMPGVLVAETVSICLMRRGHGLIFALGCARELVKKGIVLEPSRRRLVDALVLLRSETNYRNWNDQSRTSDVGLIRQEAVRLASALIATGINEPKLSEWIEETRSDPLPEVRYALLGSQDS